MQSQPVDKQTHVYKITQDVEIAADVYRMPGPGNRPAILWIHGGALIMGTRRGIPTYQLERYLHAGYTVVSIDYRLAPESKLDAIIEDLRDAYAWLLREGPTLFQLDGDRVAVAGHSAGGYLTLMAGCTLAPRPKAVVSFYGYGDIIGSWYSRPDPFYCQQPPVAAVEAYASVGHSTPTEGTSAGRGRFYLYCRQTGRWPIEVAGHDPDQEAAWFAPYCPLQNVTSAYPPTLLIHGDQDTDVPYAQSTLMATELARQGVAHRLIRMTQDGHGFDRADNAPQDDKITRLFDAVVGFLADYV